MFVLYAQIIVTILEPRKVTISARIIQTYTKFGDFARLYIFQALQHFRNQILNFTHFILFFLAVVFDSLLFT